MPSKCEVPPATLPPREGFLLGALEQALGHSSMRGWDSRGWGAVLHGTHPICMGPAASALWWVIWLHADSPGGDYHGIFFPLCFLSFSSTFSARVGSMSYVKNILIPGQY